MDAVVKMLLIIFGAVIAALCGYAGSYLKEHGKNAATKDDFDDLLEQTRQLAKATKAIEAQISDQFWNKRRLWEMKRDALLSAVGSLGRADDALLALATAYGTADKEKPEEWHETKSNNLLAYQKEINHYDEKRFEASLICGSDLDDAMRGASKLIRGAASKVLREQISGYSEAGAPIQKAILEVLTLSRKELGIGTSEASNPQSSGPSAAPNPG